jgi:hypothetical protein
MDALSELQKVLVETYAVRLSVVSDVAPRTTTLAQAFRLCACPYPVIAGRFE